MADIDKTGSISLPASGFGKVMVLHNYVDFTVTANQLANTKTMSIFDIPANVAVLYVLVKVATADAHISDVDLGIEGGTTDGFLDAMDITTTGWKSDVDEAYSIAAAAPHISTSDTVVIVTNNDAQTIDEAKIHFYAVVVDLRDTTGA